MGGAKAHYDGIVAFSQTHFTEDLKKITVPVLVMHGDDDQKAAASGWATRAASPCAGRIAEGRSVSTARDPVQPCRPAGSLPPLAAIFCITCWCSQMFMAAESSVLPV